MITSSTHLKAGHRLRDNAKQREPVRTSDQLEQQVTARFGVFAQVSGLGCIDLGDRRSGVQISPARQTNTPFEQVFRCRLGFLGGQWEFAQAANGAPPAGWTGRPPSLTQPGPAVSGSKLCGQTGSWSVVNPFMGRRQIRLHGTPFRLERRSMASDTSGLVDRRTGREQSGS